MAINLKDIYSKILSKVSAPSQNSYVSKLGNVGKGLLAQANPMQYGTVANNYLQKMANAQKQLEALKPIDINFTKNIKNPTLKKVASLPEYALESTLNAVTMRSPAIAGRQIGKDIRSGDILNPKVYFSDVAQAAEPVVDLLTLGSGSKLLKEGAEQTFKQIVKEGAKTGLKYGTGYGLMGGLQQGRNIKDNKEYLTNLGVNTIAGAGIGTAAGAGFSALGYGAGKLFKKSGVENRLQKNSDIIYEELKKYDNGPVKPGYTRTYHVIENGMDTDWRFSNEDALRRFVGNNDLSTSKIKIEDVPSNTLKLVDKDRFIVKNSKSSKMADDFDKFLRGETDEVPRMTQQEVDDLFNMAELKASDNVEMKMFKEKFNKWVGMRNASETKGIKSGLPLKGLTDEEGTKLIRFSEGQLDVKDLPDSLKDAAKYLRSAFDEAYNMARKEGIDVKYAQDYVTHIWDNPQSEVKKVYQNYLNQNFKFAQGRTIPTYDEGIAMGLTPKYTQPSQIISEYVTNVERLKSNINFFKDLRSQGLVVPAGVGAGKPGFEPIIASGFPSSRIQINENVIAGNYYAPKPVADLLNRMFSTAKDTMLGKVFGATGAASQKIQNLTLSGGIGPINAFSFAQNLKEVMALRFKSPIMSTIRAFSDKASREFFVEHIDTLSKMEESGVNLVTNLNTKTMTGKNPVKGLGGLWNRIVEEPTFKRLLPMLQVNFFEDVENSALKMGSNSDEAIKIAAKATKNFYGLTEAGTKMARDKLGQDVIRTVTFAPTYRESMINIWVNAIKGLRHPLSLENRATTTFLGSAILMYYGMDRANKAFNNGRPMSQNPKGTEDKLLIPYKGGTVGIPYLSSLATVPKALYRFFSSAVKGDVVGGIKDLASSNLSMLMKPLAEITRNENYFGAPIYDENGTALEKNSDIAYHLFKSWVIAHPYVTALMDKVSGKTKDEPLEITFSKALEMPFRYYKKGAIDTKFYFQERDKALSELSVSERKIYDGIMSSKKLSEDGLPVDVKRGEMGSALMRLAYPNILKAETQAAILTAVKTGQPVNPFYTLDPEQQQAALILKTLYPGSKEKSELTAKNIGWLKPYWTAQSAYFSELKAKGIIDSEDTNTNTMAQETLASPEISALEQEYYAIPYGTGQRTAFIKAHPELAAWWSKKTSIVNEQRSALGLTPVSSGFSSSYKKKPYFKKLSVPKLKPVSLKVKKFKKPKRKKVKVYKLKRPKLSSVKLLKTKKVKFA